MTVKKNEAGPKAGFAGDPVEDNKYTCDETINYSSFKERPLSSVSDTALSALRLRGEKMATQKHQRTRSRVSPSPKWSAERSYSFIENSTRPENCSPSWHLQPLFPDISSEQQHRESPNRVAKILKRDSWTDSLLKRQSKIEKEYKGIRDFTRSKNNTKIAVNHTLAYKPPRGYTNFVSGKPLIYQERPPSGREMAHRRFMEKLEAQNRMLRDLSDSDDEDSEEAMRRKNVLKIPSCSDMDVCIHGSCTGTSIKLAMDGLRIANNIEHSLSTEPNSEASEQDQDTFKKRAGDNDQEKNESKKSNGKNNQSQGNIDQDNNNSRNGPSTLITRGSSSRNSGKKCTMDKRNQPATTNDNSEHTLNTQGKHYNYPDSGNKLYEWSSLTTTV